MEHTIAHDKATDLLFVTVQGDWEREKDEIIVRDILERIAGTGVRKILLDIRLLTKLDFSALRLYERAQMLQDRRREAGISSTRVAILYKSQEPQIREGFMFFEDIAHNRGLPYRLFEEYESAIEWLSSP